MGTIFDLSSDSALDEPAYRTSRLHSGDHRPLLRRIDGRRAMNGRNEARREYRGLPWLIGAMLVAFVTVGLLSLFYVEKQLISAKGQALALAAADIADKLDLFLNSRFGDIQVLAGSPGL